MKHQAHETNILKIIGEGKLTFIEIYNQLTIAKDDFLQAMGRLVRESKLKYDPETGYYEKSIL